MDVTGSSESVYYMKDEEKAYIGVNETKCTNMRFIFEDGDIVKTEYYTEPVSKMTPMGMANHSAIQLEGFNWKIETTENHKH